MQAFSERRGHTIVWDEAGGRWLWEDTGQPAGWERPCAVCREPQTAEGHDPCLGALDGVSAACCGHGVPESRYVMFSDGRTLYGQEAVEYLGSVTA